MNIVQAFCSHSSTWFYTFWIFSRNIYSFFLFCTCRVGCNPKLWHLFDTIIAVIMSYLCRSMLLLQQMQINFHKAIVKVREKKIKTYILFVGWKWTIVSQWDANESENSRNNVIFMKLIFECGKKEKDKRHIVMEWIYLVYTLFAKALANAQSQYLQNVWKANKQNSNCNEL